MDKDRNRDRDRLRRKKTILGYLCKRLAEFVLLILHVNFVKKKLFGRCPIVLEIRNKTCLSKKFNKLELIVCRCSTMRPVACDCFCRIIRDTYHSTATVVGSASNNQFQPLMNVNCHGRHI